MALLKTGAKYPLFIVASFTYQCSDKDCNYSITIMEVEDKNEQDKTDKSKYPKCPKCGLTLDLISIHADSDQPEEKSKSNVLEDNND